MGLIKYDSASVGRKQEPPWAFKSLYIYYFVDNQSSADTRQKIFKKE